jgi:excisionase family DNA binding protein
VRGNDELALRAEVAALRAEVAILRAEHAAWRAERAEVEPKWTTEAVSSPPQRLLYSVREVAELLSVDKNTVYQLAYSGKLATVKLGRRRLVPAEAFEALVSEGS